MNIRLYNWKGETYSRKMNWSLTFCISAFETKEWATFSKLSFKTSVIAAVIASACFEGTPCASKLLTCHKNNPKISSHSTNNFFIFTKSKKNKSREVNKTKTMTRGRLLYSWESVNFIAKAYKGYNLLPILSH